MDYCGIKSDLGEIFMDASPHKQGKHTPLSHILIVSQDEVLRYKPDYILILPRNFKEEIVEQPLYIKEEALWQLYKINRNLVS